MPPPVALLLTIGFVVFLFRREARQDQMQSRALWLPLFWVLIIGSRFVGQWLAVWGVPVGAGSMEDGSPLDAVIFLLMIVAGIMILNRRRVALATVARHNVWISLFFAYCFVSILWSDFPFVAFKRWIKILGHPVMTLIVVTEPDPVAAFRWLTKRAAFVLLPSSVLCIKYYPHIGRGFSPWTGEATNHGVNLNKNELGYVCMLFGLFFFWYLLQARKLADRLVRRRELLLSVFFLYLVWWLLSMAHSATSLACLVLGALTIVGLNFRWVSKRYLGWQLIIGVIVFIAAETTFGIYAGVVHMLGRNLTLTDRTEVWADVLQLVDNPILGTGYESFWLGERLEVLWAKWNWQPNQAHNGYIEMYINLGLVGLFLMLAMIVAAFQKSKLEMLHNFEFGRLRIAYLFMIVIYNYTEATFKSLALVWTFFHLIALEYPRPVRVPADYEEATVASGSSSR